MEQTNDTIKRLSPVFTDVLRHCIQAEATPTLKPSTTPVFQPKQLEQPWSRIHVNFSSPINGWGFLVVVNACSKWPEIFPMEKIDTHSMIAILKCPLSQHDLLKTLVSDNVPQFISETFYYFCSSYCITHVQSPPNHP